MFALRKSMMLIILLLAMGISFIVFHQIYPEYNPSFWYSMTAIWLAEFFLGLTVTEFMDTEAKSMPLLFGNLIINIVYFLFAVLAAPICIDNVSESTLLIIHIVLLFPVIAFHIFFGIAHKVTSDHAKENKKQLLCKKMFQQKLELFKSEHADWLTGNPDLQKAVENLSDDIRFASESLPGSEEADSRILEKFNELLQTTAADAALETLSSLKSSLQYRSEVIKIMR